MNDTATTTPEPDSTPAPEVTQNGTPDVPKQEATPAPKVDTQKIADQVLGNIDIDKIKKDVRGEVTRELADSLSGKEPEKELNPVHERFVNDPEGLFRAAIDIAKEEKDAEDAAKASRLEANRKAMSQHITDYPALQNFGGEINQDFIRIQSEPGNQGLSEAEILKKSLPKTVERLEKVGAIKKVSEEEKRNSAMMVPPSRGGGYSQAPNQDYDPDKSAGDFFAQAKAMGRGFRVKKTPG
jgi:hypothetical protein